jgi:hypothetical protein
MGSTFMDHQLEPPWNVKLQLLSLQTVWENNFSYLGAACYGKSPQF